MAKFEVNKPIKTLEPIIVADGLPLGRHVFRLTVIDQNGRVSAPDELVVTVSRVQVVDPGPG